MADNIKRFLRLSKHTSSIPEDSYSHSTSENLDIVGEANTQDWLNGDYYLRIHVREARNLAVSAQDTRSADPFVRVTIDENSKHSKTATTRVIERNRNPLFCESLLLPLRGFHPSTPLRLAVYDRDFARIEFLGHVMTTLGYTLSHLKDINDEVTQWFTLTKKRASDTVAGEILFTISVVTAEDQDQIVKENHDNLDPSAESARLGSSMLEIKFHGLNNFIHSGLPDRKISFDVRIGQSVAKVPIRERSKDKLADVDGSFERDMGDVVAVPLSECFALNKLQRAALEVGKKLDAANPRLRALRKRDKETNDINIALKVGGQLVAKTQIPIWDVPFRDDKDLDDDASSRSGLTSRGSITEVPKELNEKSPKPLQGPQPSEDSVAAASVSSAIIAPPGAKMYTRLMQPYKRSLLDSEFIELAVSMTIVKKSTAPKAAAVAEADLDACEDVPDAAPITAPPPLSVAVQETSLPCGANRLFGLIFNADSPVRKKMGEIENKRDVQSTAWSADAVSGRNTRTDTYIKALKIPLPMAPKECNVTETFTAVVKEDGGFVVETRVATNAPKGDSFYVLIQLVGIQQAANNTTLRVTMQVEWIKSFMMKGMIESASSNDIKRVMSAMVAELKQRLAGPKDPSTPTAASLPGSALTPFAPAATSATPSWMQYVVLLLMFVALLLLGGVLYTLVEMKQEMSEGLVSLDEALIIARKLVASASCPVVEAPAVESA